MIWKLCVVVPAFTVAWLAAVAPAGMGSPASAGSELGPELELQAKDRTRDDENDEDAHPWDSVRGEGRAWGLWIAHARVFPTERDLIPSLTRELDRLIGPHVVEA